MEDLRFSLDDPLYVAVSAAYEAVWQLRKEAHGLSRRMGAR